MARRDRADEDATWLDADVPERRLAVAVIRQVAKDMRDRKASRRVEAERWWVSDGCAFWCDVLGLDPQRLVSGLRELQAGQRAKRALGFSVHGSG